jgi:hypothetical protein
MQPTTYHRAYHRRSLPQPQPTTVVAVVANAQSPKKLTFCDNSSNVPQMHTQMHTRIPKHGATCRLTATTDGLATKWAAQIQAIIGKAPASTNSLTEVDKLGDPAGVINVVGDASVHVWSVCGPLLQQCGGATGDVDLTLAAHPRVELGPAAHARVELGPAARARVELGPAAHAR